MRPPAYEGSASYVFISYAHKDTEPVFRVVEELQRQGIRIWYDEGIAPGSEWPENVATHLYNAGMVIAFITPRSMESENCRREINFALSKKKPFLSVVLEETKMPMGMEMQLSARQSILRYNYTTWEAFIDKILKCPDLVPCKGAGDTQNGSVGTAAPSPEMTREERETELYKIFTEAAEFEGKNQYMKELEILMKGMRIDAENTDLLTKIGRAYRRIGNNARALEYYEKAKAIAPDDPTIYLNIAIAYLVSAQYNDAKHYFDQAFAVTEKNPLRMTQSNKGTLYGNYALCLGQMGDLRSAKKHLRTAKELGYDQASIDYVCKTLKISPRSIEKKSWFF